MVNSTISLVNGPPTILAVRAKVLNDVVVKGLASLGIVQELFCFYLRHALQTLAPRNLFLWRRKVTVARRRERARRIHRLAPSPQASNDSSPRPIRSQRQRR